jgi:CBS domain containing-hemolysin-like protein
MIGVLGQLDPGAALAFGAIALAGVVAAGLTAGLETGMYSLSQVRLSIRAARGDRGAARLEREYKRPRRLLSTLLVANALAGWTASFGVSQIFDGLGYDPLQAVLLDLVVLVPVVFLFGEVLPKDLFRTHADRWMPRYAPILAGLRILLSATGVVPLVMALGSVATRIFGGRSVEDRREARARVAAMLAEGAGAEGLSEAQLGITDRVFTMRGITVGQEMKPWRQVASIEETTPAGERARRFLSSGASRLPVVDRRGRVVGVVSAVDHFARPTASTSDMLRPILLLPPSVSALDAIGRMRRERVQMAVVGERVDRPLGIVSIKDLVEPLVGDLAAW